MISKTYDPDAKRFISLGETEAFRFRFSASSIRRTTYHAGLRAKSSETIA